MHTLKISLLFYHSVKTLLTFRSAVSWKKSDINLFRATQNKFDALQTFLGDKAYKELAIITPDKKAKNSELTDLQIQANKKLSSLRIGVEHLIGKFKVFQE